ncbi:MAG TPA: glycosyltransferase family 39 protein [Candidatus Latescibacteria bacterium]|jgi:hypothetical protein|nr:hypothetical protein [Gemmatimonadaceae bacterium]HJP29335.1 glycosyltransferase family 39 protein [Candidatus Latescibacterota bacterium]
MFGIYPVNPDESLCASIAWSLWSEGRLATTLLQGALPGIEHSVYWTPPLYYLVLAGWMGLFGPGLLAVRSLSLILGLVLIVVLWQRHRSVGVTAWTSCALVLFDPSLQGAASMARMDMLAITLTAGSLTWLEVGRDERRYLGVGALAAAAILTHPLGAAAMAAAGLTSLLRGRRLVLLFLAGSVPLLLAWGVYIALDVDTFVAQMQLQLAVKSGRAQSPLGNLQRLAELSGPLAPVLAVAFVGGLAGLIAGWRELLPWLIGAVCLAPLALFSGELVYPAYMAPFTAVGLGYWLQLSRWARRAVLVAVLALSMALIMDRPPLAGIDPTYELYCSYLSDHIGPGNTVLFAILPDPWFGFQHRTDLQLRVAPPVVIDMPQLDAYVGAADLVLFGGYNPPGFISIIKRWDEVAHPGEHLWILEGGELHDFANVRDRVRFR